MKTATIIRAPVSRLRGMMSSRNILWNGKKLTPQKLGALYQCVNNESAMPEVVFSLSSNAIDINHKASDPGAVLERWLGLDFLPQATV